MRTAGLTMNDAWAHRVRRGHSTDTYQHENLAAEIAVHVESVELLHHAAQENYRPYLHVSGELRVLTFAVALPFGISEVVYSPGQGETVDAFYEFDDQQLAVLAGKGYFRRAFGVPEQITGIEWELPATVDTLVLAPEGGHDGAPVIFTRVHDIAALDIDADSSGYDLTDYFADQSTPGTPRTTSGMPAGPAIRHPIESLFTDDELALLGHEEQTRPGTRLATAADTTAGHLRRVESEIAAERASYHEQRARTAGTPEHLYRERVARLPVATDHPLATPDPELNDEQRADNDGADRAPTPSASGHDHDQPAADVTGFDIPDHHELDPGA
ncbi:hypothetical protein ACIQUM_07775 [Amycolatopsis azurea]|uniref:hypothetical protein n=1 Tax=Amycolatopsis azurea TaxID=36819 RepID=UPI00382F4DB5